MNCPGFCQPCDDPAAFRIGQRFILDDLAGDIEEPLDLPDERFFRVILDAFLSFDCLKIFVVAQLLFQLLVLIEGFEGLIYCTSGHDHPRLLLFGCCRFLLLHNLQVIAHFDPPTFSMIRAISAEISACHSRSPPIRAAVDIISSRTILFTQLVCAQRLSLRRDQSFGPIRWVLSVLPSPNLIYRSASILWQGWSFIMFSSRSAMWYNGGD